MTSKLNLKVLSDKLVVCRFDNTLNIPEWININQSDSFLSITRTSDELSIVCDEELVPDDIQSERGWRIIKVMGPLDFSLTGILTSLTQPLSEAGISLFAISTYDTDYILVKEDSLEIVIAIYKTFCEVEI
jgi:uncharacterized protein